MRGHRCLVCGGLLEQPATGRPRQTCSDVCRQRKRRGASTPKPDAALLRRYDAALNVLETESKIERRPMTEEQRLSLVAAVVWPKDLRLQDERLREVA
jgi:hypothetical protein